MIRLARIAIVPLLLAAAVVPVSAQEPLSKRVSLDLKAMAPPDAFKALADAVGLKVSVDAAVTAPVDILVRNVKASTALTTMCESIGCEWSVGGGTLTISPARALEVRRAARPVRRASPELVERFQSALRRTLPADMKFDNAPLTVVSQRLTEALGIRITIACDDPAKQTLTLDLGNQTLMSGLKNLGSAGGTETVWRLTLDRDASGTEGPAIRIMWRSGSREPRKR
jgi:hypothetical protein